MRLSIVIVNWNTRELLARCLASIEREYRTFPVSEVETFVVDNASTDDSAALVTEDFPWVKLISNSENVGFSRANNQALRQAVGQYLLLLNSDTIVKPGALTCLINELVGHLQAGAAGPKVLNPDGSLQNCYGSLPSVANEIIGPYALDVFNKPWGRIGSRMLSTDNLGRSSRVVDRVSFACTMIRREALEQVGLLDERFEFYSEDYDWFMRLRQAGWQTIFCPQAQIVHFWGASSSQRSEWSLRQLYRSKRLYFTKHHGATTGMVLRVGLIGRFAFKWLTAMAKYPVDKAAAARQMALYRQLMRDMLQRVSS